MSVPLYWVDAFTDHPFSGNPAAVCLLDSPLPDVRMQDIAAEMNLSETAFLLPEAEGYRLRWFTPAAEVDLCGHATLAGAFVLWHTGHVAPTAPIAFHTRSGLLTARQDLGLIRLDFPACPATACPTPSELSSAVPEPLLWVGSNGSDLLVELSNEAAVRDLVPNLSLLAAVPVRGVIVTARSERSGVDFVSRFFAPRYGVPEDPVTGSAHCCLAPFWAERLGRPNLTGYQASRRGGTVKVRLQGDRVELGGKAVLVAQGTLVV